jgi:ribosomal protein S27AE
MRFGKRTIKEVIDRLDQLGLDKCPVCDGGLVADHRPVIVTIGGLLHEEGDPRRDPEAELLFLIRLSCQLCGYTMLFDAEHHRRGDEPTMFLGPEELEDEIDPPDS